MSASAKTERIVAHDLARYWALVGVIVVRRYRHGSLEWVMRTVAG
jgi:hypothetical protein